MRLNITVLCFLLDQAQNETCDIFPDFRDFGCVIGLANVKGLCRKTGNTGFTKTQLVNKVSNTLLMVFFFSFYSKKIYKCVEISLTLDGRTLTQVSYLLYLA
jgi:hypothetical protein